MNFLQIGEQWQAFVDDYMRRHPEVEVAVTWVEFLNDRATFHIGREGPPGARVAHVVRRLSTTS